MYRRTFNDWDILKNKDEYLDGVVHRIGVIRDGVTTKPGTVPELWNYDGSGGFDEENVLRRALDYSIHQKIDCLIGINVQISSPDIYEVPGQETALMAFGRPFAAV